MSELAIPAVKKINGVWCLGKLANGQFKAFIECESSAEAEWLHLQTLRESEIQHA